MSCAGVSLSARKSSGFSIVSQSSPTSGSGLVTLSFVAVVDSPLADASTAATRDDAWVSSGAEGWAVSSGSRSGSSDVEGRSEDVGGKYSLRAY